MMPIPTPYVHTLGRHSISKGSKVHDGYSSAGAERNISTLLLPRLYSHAQLHSSHAPSQIFNSSRVIRSNDDSQPLSPVVPFR